MKRAVPGVSGGQTEKSFVDSFADTRKDPIKRRKIHRVLDFVEVNKEAYRQYLQLDERDTEKRLQKLEASIRKKN